MTAPELPELVDLDVLGDSDTLREQADAVLAAEEPADEYKAADPSGSIWVSVDPRGRVLDVEISRTWTERMAPEAFGDALFGAYTTAARKALIVESATRERPAPRRQRPVATDAGLSPEAWLARVGAELERIGAELRAAARATPEVLAEQEFRGRNGYLTLRLTAGAPAGITGGPGLANANRGRLREDVLDIFEDADLISEGVTR